MRELRRAGMVEVYVYFENGYSAFRRANTVSYSAILASISAGLASAYRKAAASSPCDNPGNAALKLSSEQSSFRYCRTNSQTGTPPCARQATLRRSGTTAVSIDPAQQRKSTKSFSICSAGTESRSAQSPTESISWSTAETASSV